MKRLLLILVYLPMIGFGQLSVDINSGYLNLREKPHEKSRILDRLDDGESLEYTGEWNGPWIKAMKSTGYLQKEIVGWVHKDYVSAPNFKSRFLGNTKEVLGDEYEGAGCFLSSVEGSIMAYSTINLQGRKTELFNKKSKDFSIYYNSEISIKLFTLGLIRGATYKCLAIINYKGEEEVIFVKFMCGC